MPLSLARERKRLPKYFFATFKYMEGVKIRGADDADTEFLMKGIKEFWLDGAGFLATQFLIAEKDGKRIGFGRIREHADCNELCTLGVLEKERNKGVGRMLIKALTEKAGRQRELYLVCIIPPLFEPLGFEIVNTYPASMADKLYRCETELSVPEKYVVMKFEPAAL